MVLADDARRARRASHRSAACSGSLVARHGRSALAVKVAGEARALEPVVDGLAKAMVGNRHDRDRLDASFIERRCSAAKKFAAASTRSPRRLRLIVGPAKLGAFGPKASNASPLRAFARIEAKRRRRRIMGGELTWRGHMAAGFARRKLAPKDRLDLLARKGAQAKQGDFVAVDAEHRRTRVRACMGRRRGSWPADVAKLRLDMGGGGRAYPARTVGARRGDGKLRRFKQGAGDWMARGAERDGVETGADEIGDGAAGRLRGSTSDRGPGQKARISLRAVSLTTA